MNTGNFFVKDLEELYKKSRGKISLKDKNNFCKKWDIDGDFFDESHAELISYKNPKIPSRAPIMILIGLIVVLALIVFFTFMSVGEAKVETANQKLFEPKTLVDSTTQITESNAASPSTGEEDIIKKEDINPKQTYNELIQEALIAYENDKLEEALEKVTLAAVIKSDFGIKNSPEAEQLYSNAYSNGDVLLELNDKSLMPLAKRHFQIAQQIEKSAGINQKIAKCK